MWFVFKYLRIHDKANKVTVRPAKTQISLGIRQVWSESSLYAQWVAKDPSFLHADSEDPDQTGRFVGFVMKWLISDNSTLKGTWTVSELDGLIIVKTNAIQLLDMIIIGPRQANWCLRAFRHDKFQLRMPSHSEGPGIWLSVWRFLLIHCLYERAAKVLARLRGCAGSPEPSLLA